MSITLIGANATITSAFLNAMASWINARTPVFKTSTVATSTTTTTETKDTNVGDLTFVVSDATVWYRITYMVRMNTDSTTGASLISATVRDGGASSPTNTSTLIGETSQVLTVAGGPGQVATAAISLRQFSVGTHNIAGFYVRSSGAGNVSLVALDGGGATLARFLSVEQIT